MINHTTHLSEQDEYHDALLTAYQRYASEYASVRGIYHGTPATWFQTGFAAAWDLLGENR